MTKIKKLSLPKRGEIHSYLIASDWHSKYLSESSYSILKQFAKKMPKPRTLIINGDFLDADFLMARSDEFKLWIKRPNSIEEFFIEKAEEELEWGNKVLDELQKIFDRIVFVEGNHDWRYNWFKSTFCPVAYQYLFDYRLQLGFDDRGIDSVGYNDWLDIGKLSVTHGMFHGTTCLKKHYEACGGRSVMFGHVHHADVKSFSVRGKTRKAWSLPAMCELNPEYMKNRDSNWSNGFASVYVKSNGDFQTHIHEIWDNELILPNGKAIK